MTNELDFLIKAARRYTMTKDEQRAQIKSFAFGNTHMENDRITREDIESAMDTLQTESDTAVRS